MTKNETIERYLNINMHYQAGRNNNETGKQRRNLTIKVCARFNMIDPVLVQWLYGIPHHLALLHLNKLVERDKLLICVKTIRAPTGCIYVLNHNGANYATELLSLSIPFKKTKEPSRQVNQNSIMHDLMNAFICLRGLHEYNGNGIHSPLWKSMVSEKEFKRIFTESSIRNVDGLITECNENGTIAAIEIENSYKNYRQSILLKYLDSLKEGHYQKVFLFSQSLEILKDIKRVHSRLFEELTTAYNKKTRQPFITEADANLLRSAIVYRTKFCDELQNLFYP